MALDDPTCGNYWTITTNRASDGTSALHFGNAADTCGIGEAPVCGGLSEGLCPSYDCGANGTYGELTTRAYDIPNVKTLLSFDLMLTNEWNDITFDSGPCTSIGLCADRLSLYGEYDAVAGAQKVLLWDSFDIEGTTACDWESINVDLASVQGKTVTFRFEYDSGLSGGDAEFNDYEGPYIDNFVIDPKCGADICTTASECADLPCQAKSCEAGLCTYTAIEGCCAEDADCNDGLTCTTDVCSEGVCSATLNGNPSCCQAQATYQSWDFEGDAMPEGWTVTTPDGAAGDVMWRWVSDGGVDGSAGFTFSNAAGTSYDGGGLASRGMLDTPAMLVPAGGDPILAFDLYLSTEFDSMSTVEFDDYVANLGLGIYLDRLSVYASTDGETWSTASLWRSDDGQPLRGNSMDPDGALQWASMAVSLSAYAGQQVYLRFEFDSGDATVNDYAGARLDNLRLSQVCPSVQQPDPCYSDAWCEDGDGCTTNLCSQGACAAIDLVDKVGCCFPDTVAYYPLDQETDAAGWTVTPAADSVRWHVTDTRAKQGSGSLRFGHVSDTNYSSCECTADDACDGGCTPAQCLTESGQSSPAGETRSPALSVKKGSDYSVEFSLRPELSLDEGPYGFLEGFTVKLIWESGVGDQTLATLVCHAAECDVLGNPCASGINFDYPTCGGPSAVGDYSQWTDYSFVLSEVLCAEAATNAAANSFISSLNALPAGSTLPLRLAVSMSTSDNVDNCEEGLFLDEVRFAHLCTDWTGVCQ